MDDQTQRLRIATFNLENLDEVSGEEPLLETRISLMRPQLLRMDADVVCLQEVHGQGDADSRELSALEQLLKETPYADFHRASTQVEGSKTPYAERNLLVLSRFPISSREQYRNDRAPAPLYRTVTAEPPEEEAEPVRWERPILHVTIELPGERPLHILNLHLKSKIPTDVAGQKEDAYTWKSASGWAEGFFLSSVKRVGQALETRMIVDGIFDGDEDALLAVCGDFNADLEEVPVLAIRGDVESTGNGALAGRVLIPTENSVPESSRYTLFYRGRKEMIDHLLVSRSLLRHHRATEIHNELLHDESFAFATDEKYPESDHAPVIAHFEVPVR
jgi:endonuclease/exonuclease/phosphatase family metal-dependent hydrolase